jgi:adenosylhomocysteine nucleosidase
MMTPNTHQIVVLISSDEEWQAVKEIKKPKKPLQSSPFGEWFLQDIKVKDRQIPVAFFQTGCGKIPAAAATQYVLNKWNQPLIINLGTCGGFKGKVQRGDILLVTKTVVYDIYERSGGHDEQVAKYTTDLDVSWLEKPYPMNAQPATMATADQDLHPGSISHLYEKYGAVAADWESGAIAYVANKNNKTRCLILRGVSDVIDPDGGKPSSEEEIVKGTRIVMRKLVDSLPERIAKVRRFGPTSR